MQLEVQEARPADIESAKAIYGPETGDLCAASLGVGLAFSDSHDLETAKKRAEWSCQQQKDLLENDPTTRFLKVVDIDNNDGIVAFGRWHRYPNGAQTVADLETVGLKDRHDPATFPDGFRKDFYLGFLDEIGTARESWMGTGHCWVLTNVKTREPFQKKGAGSLVVKWGLEQAAAEGVPAYLESGMQAKGLYEKHGFREIGRHNVDCTSFGMPGVVIEIARMKADPK
ncbi:hypothetical protein LTR37_002108 [Vermiconidia calcicola]|uniref:Uncharacterized protein n=1 Tax=Vermiconidia calcicola TaxID=1690605 RepID=A0ACC3NU63_9PEZI|nr:hypothetical protein LTR37_002108 [Vermiconidia calcicola]